MFALCPTVTLRPVVPHGVVERELDDPPGPGDRDGLDGHTSVLAELVADVTPELLPQGRRLWRPLLELDSGVQVLGVLAHHDQVQPLPPRADSRKRPRRSDRGEQVEVLPQGDVHAPEPRADRRRDRPLQRRAGPPDRLEHPVGERGSLAFHDGRPGVLDVPFELHPGGVEHELCRLRHLRPDAVPGDERDRVCHAIKAIGKGRGAAPLREPPLFEVPDARRRLVAAAGLLDAVHRERVAGVLLHELGAVVVRDDRRHDVGGRVDRAATATRRATRGSSRRAGG